MSPIDFVSTQAKWSSAYAGLWATSNVSVGLSFNYSFLIFHPLVYMHFSIILLSFEQVFLSSR